MRVEVDIVSGRPNPFWTASPQEAEALTDRLRLLTPKDRPAAAGAGDRAGVEPAPALAAAVGRLSPPYSSQVAIRSSWASGASAGLPSIRRTQVL